MKKRYVGEGGRYVPKKNSTPTLTLSGRIYLKYEDEELQPQTGDLLLYLNTDSQAHLQQGDYHSRGHAGYFRTDVYDGRRWQPAAVSDFFPEREHHFSKSERAIDTYRYCVDLLKSFAGRALERTYREHYSLREESSEEE